MSLATHHYIGRRVNHVTILRARLCACGFEKDPGRPLCTVCRARVPERIMWHLDTCPFRWFLAWWRLATKWTVREAIAAPAKGKPFLVA